MIFDMIIETYARVMSFWDRMVYCTFSPSNKIKLRNVHRGFVDRDARMFHASFTLLCEYVEREWDGLENLLASIAETPNSLRARGNKTLAELYEWYNSVDWENHVPYSPEYNAAISAVTYETIHVNEHLNRGIRVVGDPEDVAKLTELREEHRQKVEKFERLRQYNFLKLARNSKHMWR